MKLIGLFAFGFFAAIVTAMPAPTDDKDPKTPACELSGMVYNGAGKECQCPPGQEKKPNRGKCGYKPFPQPHCGHEEKPYCSKSKHEYCHYDEHNDYCEDDGKNHAFCCKDSDIHKCLASYYG